MTLCGFDWPAGRSKQVAYLDERDHIQEIFVKEGEFWQEHDLTAITHAPRASDMSPLAGFSWAAGGTKQIIYMDRNRHIQELHTDTRVWWQCTDLTALTHAPLVDGTALAGFEWTAGNTKQVVYVDHNYHIQELYVGPGGQWQIVDLTELTGAPLAEGTHIVGYDWPAGSSKQVAYIDNRGHIIELHVGVGGQWRFADITELTSAPLADRGNLGPSLTAFSWEAGNSKQIIYQDRNEHIMEMYVTVGGHWQLVDLTRVAQAPLANSIGGIVGYDWPAGRSKQIAYVDSNYHIQELYVGENDYWRCADLMAATGAPRVQEGPIAGFTWSTAHTKQVVYTGPRDSIQELYVGVGGQWQVADLTLLTSSLMLV
jgi:hypothetical protein